MTDKFIKFLNETAKVNEAFLKAASHVHTSAVQIWKQKHVNPFTDHSISHSERVLKFALQISKKLESQLNDEEIFLLTSACLLHDIGMQYKRFAEKNDKGESSLSWDDVRTRHAANSVLIMKGLFGDEDCLNYLKGLIPTLTPVTDILRSQKINPKTYISILGTVIMSHTKDSSGREAGWYSACKNSTPGRVRIDLLAALLRFCDELDVTKERIGEDGYDMFESESIPLDSLQYWLSSTVIDKIDLKEVSSGIIIYIKPDFHSIPRDKNLSDLACFLIFNLYKKLIRSLNKSIIPNMPTIGDVLSKYGIFIRIDKLDYKEQTGLLDVNKDAHYLAFEKVLKRLSSIGFLSEHFSIEVYRFKKIKNARACLINEMNGLCIPDSFKEKLVDWIIKELSGNFNYTYHTCFSKFTNGECQVLEYLPDKSISSHSILGAAVATKSYSQSIEKLCLLPDKIICSTDLQKNTVNIVFPSFSNTSFDGKKINVINKWSLVEISYSTSVADMNAVAFAVMTDLGNTTLVVIPASQDFEYAYAEKAHYLPAAGIKGFFNEQPRKISDRKKWAAEREGLLLNITESFKRQYGVKKNTICAIVDYIETKKRYQVIAWRDSSLKFDDYLHAGIIASSFFYLDNKSRNKFTEFPLHIPVNHFPKNKLIEIELWGNSKANSFSVGLANDEHISLSLEIEKSGEMKTKDFVGAL